MDMTDISNDTGAFYFISPGVTQPLVTQIMPDGSMLGERVVLADFSGDSSLAASARDASS